MEWPYIFFINIFFPWLYIVLIYLLHAQTRARLERYQQAITQYCILLMKRSKNMLNVLRILQVDVLTENVDMQTGGRVAKMRGLGNTNDSPNTWNEYRISSACSYSRRSYHFYFYRFWRLKDRLIRRWRLCKEWENKWFLALPWIAC